MRKNPMFEGDWLVGANGFESLRSLHFFVTPVVSIYSSPHLRVIWLDVPHRFLRAGLDVACIMAAVPLPSRP